jgi:hypothetical protein
LSEDLVVGGDPDLLEAYSDEVLALFTTVEEALTAYRDAVAAFTAAPSEMDVSVTDRSLDVEQGLSDLEEADRIPGAFGELLRDFDGRWEDAVLADLLADDPMLAALMAGGVGCEPLTGEGAVALVLAFFGRVDVAGQDPDDADDRVTRDDLEAIADDERQPEALRLAAAWLLAHDDAFDDVETAFEGGGTDGRLSLDDAVAFLENRQLTEGEVEHVGLGHLDVPEGAEVVTFPIPEWEGHGTTRFQYFIEDVGEDVCLSGTGPDVACGEGDNRDFAEGGAVDDYNLAARVRVVLDHEAGQAAVVSYPTHGSDGEVAALPVELTVDPGNVRLPDDYPSQVRVYTYGDGIDGNVVFDYRFVNSMTPEAAGGVAPGINGAVRVRQGENGTVEIDGALAQYPSVEIMRDRPGAGGEYQSEVIFQRRQESGGPLNLTEPSTPFEASG